MSAITRRAACASLFVLASGNAAARNALRVVSLSPCLDTILVHLSPRSHIAALSHYARDESTSSIADLAATLPFTYESAEEIINHRPSVVLASRHSGPATRASLERLNIHVAEFGVPESVDASLAQIREVGRLVNQNARAAALIESIERALAAAEPRVGYRPIKALVFQARGLAAGDGTLVDEMLRRTGFENAAARYGVRRWGNVSLERLIADPPELLLSSRLTADGPSYAERLLRHPALDAIARSMRRAEFPEACLYCGGPVLLRTAAALTNAREGYWRAVRP